MQSADVVVIGSGIGGLCAAKTYKQLAPGAHIIIFEQRDSVGGVWSKQNLYEGIKTNNLVGTYEFSDFPLFGNPKYGVPEGKHIPGHVMAVYLEDYAKHFGIFDLIQFGTKVKVIEKLNDKRWRISGKCHGEAVAFECNKLIVSNGLASTPRPISLPGMQNFDRPLFNHGSLKNTAQTVATDPSISHVTVIGASKIGYDAVYLFASHGKRVTWLIRKSGGGAVWMSPPWIPLGPWTVMLEHVVTTRFFTWFSPCIWGHFDGFGWVRRFLHGTPLGRWLVHGFWEKQRADTVGGNGYRREEKLKELEPTESLFWNPRVGIHNYPTDVHDFLRSGQVEIERKDIATVGAGGKIAFTDGTEMETDAICAITGWQLTPNITYKPHGIDAELGVPSSSYTEKQTALWADLDAGADEEILNRFPYLRNPPQAKLPYMQTVTPFRLYRGIAPPGLTAKGDNSLGFMKMVHCTANLIIAETQALWVFAYLNDRLPIPNTTRANAISDNSKANHVYKDTALTSRYGKHRYPWGFSAWWPEFVYDAVPYADMLLADLGLRRWRKGSWWREVGEGYTVHDYKGVCGEWAVKEGWRNQGGGTVEEKR